ncbi:putative baseplate assembly protein [Micromonospora sp. CPCC 205711]|uniref:putative baseplate assembly protein n=1 Tax=Micromonospora sp. CPCC 205547 TaxID=3122400 RepID=UPI002FF3C664
MTVRCTDDERRADVARPGSAFNGIDWVEVDPADQRLLRVGFLHPLPGQTGGVPSGAALAAGNVVVEGGVRITGVRVESVTAAAEVLTVRVDRAGDFSPYTLRLVRSAVDDRVPPGFDPVLAAAAFSFKANCPSDLDPAPAPAPGPAPRPATAPADYLAKDYAGFRRLMLDRISALPGWSERNPADPLITVVEALAHVADRLSYRQDAAGTETYLDTARSRISVRRHARLLDYVLHDGCAARAWLSVRVAAGSAVETGGVPAGTPVLAADRSTPAVSPADAATLLAAGATGFETLTALAPRASRNEIALHVWGGRDCCLPAGSTRATLVDQPATGLAPGDLLLLEEVVSPETGRRADADPTHRQVVRLVSVRPGTDPVEGVTVLEVEWGAADRLAFGLTVTASVAGSGTEHVVTCAVARANVVAVQHAIEVRGQLPPAAEHRWRPLLTGEPVAAAAPFPLDAPASQALDQDPRAALPLIRLETTEGSWRPRRDLLNADRFDQGFVPERESDGRVSLRFGDDVSGRRPPAGTVFQATWWRGGGAAGNLGHDALTTLVTGAAGILAVTNPLPAVGGTDPEDIEHARQHAPVAFATQERAVTTADWVAAALRLPEVDNATARIRWTGSWWTVFLTLDLAGGQRLADEPGLARRLAGRLDRFRVAGYDLQLRDPVDLPVELRLWVCVAPGAFRSDVRRALLDVFATRDLPGGVRGFFHPDRFTFGTPLYVSQLLAAAVTVPGVTDVRVTELHPVGVAPGGELAARVLRAGDTEVIRLDNDPSVPEHGILHLDLVGGL